MVGVVAAQWHTEVMDGLIAGATAAVSDARDIDAGEPVLLVHDLEHLPGNREAHRPSLPDLDPRGENHPRL